MLFVCFSNTNTTLHCYCKVRCIVEVHCCAVDDAWLMKYSAYSLQVVVFRLYCQLCRNGIDDMDTTQSIRPNIRESLYETPLYTIQSMDKLPSRTGLGLCSPRHPPQKAKQSYSRLQQVRNMSSSTSSNHSLQEAESHAVRNTFFFAYCWQQHFSRERNDGRNSEPANKHCSE